MNNFDLKSFLTENKLTSNSKNISEASQQQLVKHARELIRVILNVMEDQDNPNVATPMVLNRASMKLLNSEVLSTARDTVQDITGLSEEQKDFIDEILVLLIREIYGTTDID